MRRIRKAPELDEVSALQEQIDALRAEKDGLELRLVKAESKAHVLAASEERLQRALATERNRPPTTSSGLFSKQRALDNFRGLRIRLSWSRGRGSDDYCIEDSVQEHDYMRMADASLQSLHEQIGCRVLDLLRELSAGGRIPIMPPRMLERVMGVDVAAGPDRTATQIISDRAPPRFAQGGMAPPPPSGGRSWFDARTRQWVPDTGVTPEEGTDGF